MKKKIKEISNSQMNEICAKYRADYCRSCPLKRIKNGRELIFCYKQCRARYLADKIWFETNYTGDFKKEKLEELLEDQKEIEEEEIEL